MSANQREPVYLDERGGAVLASAIEPERPVSHKRKAAFILGAVLLAGILYYALHYLVQSFTHENTDDAFIETSIVMVSPRVAGLVAAVHVQDNQWVKSGDPLVDIDQRDYEVNLTHKRANQLAAESNKKSAQASYKLMSARLATAEATAKQSVSEVAASQATADRAAADLQRVKQLVQTGVATPQEYDQARAEATAAKARADADRDKVLSDQSKVVEAREQLDVMRAALETVNAQIKQSQADVNSAELDLSYTHIVAPINGTVTRKAVHAGEYVQVGQRMLALVPEHVWIIANYKETQLAHIQPGQRVDIEVDAYPGHHFQGHVDSIQAGSGTRFSLLPPENAVGNFVKVVQRVPVKILFDTPLDHRFRLGPGMSVVPYIRISNFAVSAGILLLVAVALSLIITVIAWQVLARRRAKDTSVAT